MVMNLLLPAFKFVSAAHADGAGHSGIVRDKPARAFAREIYSLKKRVCSHFAECEKPRSLASREARAIDGRWGAASKIG
jgi:hypothetical protein